MAPVSEAIQELWNFAVESEIVHDFEDFFVNFVDFVERNVIYPCTRTIFLNIFRAYVYVILSIPNFNFVLLLDNWNWYREQNECNVLFRYLTNEINYDFRAIDSDTNPITNNHSWRATVTLILYQAFGHKSQTVP